MQHHERAEREPLCSFCGGTDIKNKLGSPETMVSCARCGRSGHPTCLNMLTPKLRKRVMLYNWHCIECKTCEQCFVKGDDSRLMFCDSCDRGWHSYCLDPPLAKPPKGSWHCPKCALYPGQSAASPSRLSVTLHTPKLRIKATKPRLNSALTPIAGETTPSTRKRNNKPRQSLAGDEALLSQQRIKVKIPNPVQLASDRNMEDRSTPMIVRLRVPKRLVEEDSEQDKVPYGGVISGDDADTTKTRILEGDKEAYESARRAAEIKMGGLALVQREMSVPGSPAPRLSPGLAQSSGPGGKSRPAQASRLLRDRLLHNLSEAPPTPGIATPGPHPLTPSSSLVPGSTPARLEKINKIRFGTYDIDTWYTAPYPEEYAHVPDGRLWLCEFCLKFMKSGFVANRHRLKCKVRHPPGDEIYRDGPVSVFEVDGRKNKIYCQNLCLLAKMFLDHKTLYYDVEPFLFYIMTQSSPLGLGEQFVGYFSKEKRGGGRNVSCIMTLPVRQREGWGQLLIDFSYLLSKKEERVGSPEKPLSGLGAVSYKSYWRVQVFKYLQNATGRVSLSDISKATSMTPEDIYTTLIAENMINVYHPDSVEPIPIHSLSASLSRASSGVDAGAGTNRARRGRGRPSMRRKVPSTLGQGGGAGGGGEDEGEDGKGGEEHVRLPKKYELVVDRDYIRAVLEKQDKKGYLELKKERLKYHPFLMARQRDAERGKKGGAGTEEEDEEGEEGQEDKEGEEEEVGELIEVTGIAQRRVPPSGHRPHPDSIHTNGNSLGHFHAPHHSPTRSNSISTTPGTPVPLTATPVPAPRKRGRPRLSAPGTTRPTPGRTLRKRKSSEMGLGLDTPARRLRSRDSVAMAVSPAVMAQVDVDGEGEGDGLPLGLNRYRRSHAEATTVPRARNQSVPYPPHHPPSPSTSTLYTGVDHPLQISYGNFHARPNDNDDDDGLDGEWEDDAEGEDEDAEGEEWEGEEEDAEGEEWDDDGPY